MGQAYCQSIALTRASRPCCSGKLGRRISGVLPFDLSDYGSIILDPVAGSAIQIDFAQPPSGIAQVKSPVRNALSVKATSFIDQ